MTIDSTAWTGRPGTLRGYFWLRPLLIGVNRIHNGFDCKDGKGCKGVGLGAGWIIEYYFWSIRIRWGWKHYSLLRIPHRAVVEYGSIWKAFWAHMIGRRVREWA